MLPPMLRRVASGDRPRSAARARTVALALWGLLVALGALLPAVPVLACTAAGGEPAEGSGGGVSFSDGVYVLVAPFNLPVALPDELRGKTAPVGRALVEYLERRGASVDALPASYAHGLWQETRDELTVGTRPPSLREVCSGLARALAERERFDYLLVPTLVPRLALVQGRRARWDGVERPIVLRDYRQDRVLQGQTNSSLRFQGSDLSGRLGAASIHLAVLAPSGELLYDGIGGLSLLHEAHGSAEPGSESLGVELVVREQPFDRPRDLHEGIRIAFERHLPTTPPSRH